MYVINEITATVTAYVIQKRWRGLWICCNLVLCWMHIIVVSEIGEQWSPHTAPAIHAEIAIIIIVYISFLERLNNNRNKDTKCSHEALAYKSKPQPTNKYNCRKEYCKTCCTMSTIPLTYSAAPRPLLVISLQCPCEKQEQELQVPYSLKSFSVNNPHNFGAFKILLTTCKKYSNY